MFLMQYVGTHTSIFRKIGMALLFIKMAGTRYTKKEFFIVLPLLLLSLYNYEICGTSYCIYNILFIACMKDIDYPTLFKVLFFATFGTLMLLGILSIFGIGSPVSMTQEFGRGGIETRYCFGLHHPNLWHQAVARCIVFFVLGYAKQIKWYHLAGLFFLNVCAYHFSVSRTGLLTVSAFLLILIFYKIARPMMNHWLMKICIFAGTLGIYIGYLYLCYDFSHYLTEFAQIFDMKYATGRLGHAVRYLSEHPIQPLGTRFPNDGTLFDCGFLRMFSESGYLLGGLLMICTFVLLFLALKNNWSQITAVIIFIVLYSLYEISPMTRAPHQMTVFYFGLLLFPNLRSTVFREPSA